MYQIIHETIPHYSVSWIFPGINLSSFLNDKETSDPVAVYQDSVAIDLTTNKTVEYYYLLADLGLKLDDTVEVNFWHYNDKSAGQNTVTLHRTVGTSSIGLIPLISFMIVITLVKMSKRKNKR